jgi:hypothetical protein
LKLEICAYAATTHKQHTNRRVVILIMNGTPPAL